VVAQQSDRQEHERKYEQIVAKAWTDPAFKARLLADPHAVFAEYQLAVPAGTRVRVVEDTEQERHFVLPRRPADLTDEQLDLMAGGKASAFGVR
jgi:hypothetical protein